MNTEYEVKFCGIDIDAIRETLKNNGGDLENPMRLMRRVVIDTPELKEKDAFLRVRDEGGRITLTYKQFQGSGVDGAKELEVNLNDPVYAERFERELKMIEEKGYADYFYIVSDLVKFAKKNMI